MASNLEHREDVHHLAENLGRTGITLRCFDTPQQAADYLDGAIDNTTVGFGGSVTVQELDLYPRLKAHNRVFWHWQGDSTAAEADTDVYITSLNAIAATGELINIDGGGNRVSSATFGHRKVIFVAGINKLAATYDQALWRARNIAAPKNAQRLHKSTPCAQKGDRCYDCSSPERICRALSVLWGKPSAIPEMELVLIDAHLGY